MNNDSMQFEAAVARLEEIVRAMEQGDLPLKIAQLMKGADGVPVELEFSHADEGE